MMSAEASSSYIHPSPIKQFFSLSEVNSASSHLRKFILILFYEPNEPLLALSVVLSILADLAEYVILLVLYLLK